MRSPEQLKLQRQINRDNRYVKEIEKSDRTIAKSDLWEKGGIVVMVSGVIAYLLTRNPDIAFSVGAIGASGAGIAHVVKRNAKINRDMLQNDRTRDVEA